MGMGSSKIQAIQSLRAVAVLMVVTRHSDFPSAWGGAGVDLFFVISGFVMVYSSRALFGDLKSVPIFALRRLIRIAPLYWIIILATLVIKGGSDISVIARSASFLPSPHGLVVPPGWTLILEMFFYLLFALALFFPRRQASMLICFLVVALVSTHWHPINNFHRVYSSPIMLEFCAGVIIGNIYLERATPLSNKTALMLIAAGVAIFCANSAIADFEQSQYRTAFWGLPATLVGAGVALGPNRRNRILEFLGEASYSIYLTHWLVFVTVPLPSSWPLQAAIGILSGVAVFLLIERPVTRWLTRLAQTPVASHRVVPEPYAQTGHAPSTL
jgi:peptidoglycan/LPS O-acetylase OafA/YrhL